MIWLEKNDIQIYILIAKQSVLTVLKKESCVNCWPMWANAITLLASLTKMLISLIDEGEVMCQLAISSYLTPKLVKIWTTSALLLYKMGSKNKCENRI